MFFPPPRKPSPPPKGVPMMTGIPGLQLNLNVDHVQLLGTVVMMGLARRPGFKEEMEEMMAFMKRMQEAVETIHAQMEAVNLEFQRVNAKVAEKQSTPQDPRQEGGGTFMNPFLQHLFKLMS